MGTTTKLQVRKVQQLRERGGEKKEKKGEQKLGIKGKTKKRENNKNTGQLLQ